MRTDIMTRRGWFADLEILGLLLALPLIAIASAIGALVLAAKEKLK